MGKRWGKSKVKLEEKWLKNKEEEKKNRRRQKQQNRKNSKYLKITGKRPKKRGKIMNDKFLSKNLNF